MHTGSPGLYITSPQPTLCPIPAAQIHGNEISLLSRTAFTSYEHDDICARHKAQAHKTPWHFVSVFHNVIVSCVYVVARRVYSQKVTPFNARSRAVTICHTYIHIWITNTLKWSNWSFFFHLLLLHHQTARFYCVQRLHLFVVLKKCNVDSIQLITSIFSRQSHLRSRDIVWYGFCVITSTFEIQICCGIK